MASGGGLSVGCSLVKDLRTDSAKSAAIRRTTRPQFCLVARRHHVISSTPLDFRMRSKLIGLSAGHFAPSDLQSFRYPYSQGECSRSLASVVVSRIFFMISLSVCVSRCVRPARVP